MHTETLCPKCNSENIIFSKKRDAYICEDCGHVLPDLPVAPLRIFLSYGHDDNEDLVRRIKADLEKRGHDVWFDKAEIKFGDEWRCSITDGILQSNRVLSFLSKHSTRDPGVCRDEIAIAIGVKGGNIQTILVESEAEVQPPVITRSQAVTLRLNSVVLLGDRHRCRGIGADERVQALASWRLALGQPCFCSPFTVSTAQGA